MAVPALMIVIRRWRDQRRHSSASHADRIAIKRSFPYISLTTTDESDSSVIDESVKGNSAASVIMTMLPIEAVIN